MSSIFNTYWSFLEEEAAVFVTNVLPYWAVEIWLEVYEVLQQLVDVQVVLGHDFADVPVHCRHLLDCVKETERVGRDAEVHWQSDKRGEVYSLKIESIKIW